MQSLALRGRGPHSFEQLTGVHHERCAAGSSIRNTTAPIAKTWPRIYLHGIEHSHIKYLNKKTARLPVKFLAMLVETETFWCGLMCEIFTALNFHGPNHQRKFFFLRVTNSLCPNREAYKGACCIRGYQVYRHAMVRSVWTYTNTTPSGCTSYMAHAPCHRSSLLSLHHLPWI